MYPGLRIWEPFLPYGDVMGKGLVPDSSQRGGEWTKRGQRQKERSNKDDRQRGREITWREMQQILTIWYFV